MTEEVEFNYQATEESMQKTVEHLEAELSKIRAGKAHPNMLSGINVPYYGAPTNISQVASVSNQDGRTLVIKPFEKSLLQEIEKAIFASNLGVTPQNDGDYIRISIPPLTEERRKVLVKDSKACVENAKVSFRSARKDANDTIKTLVKDGLPEDAGKDAEAGIQSLLTKYTTQVEDTFKRKEIDIMSV